MIAPKEKFFKKIVLPVYRNVRSEIWANNKSFKTTQIYINGWITINPDLEDTEIFTIIHRAKRNIQKRIDKLRLKTRMYESDSIVDFQTAIEKYKKKDVQFLKIDIVLFNKTQEYNKRDVVATIQPFLKEIINNDLVDDNVFNFVDKD